MRTIILAVITVLVLQITEMRAEKVKFNFDANLFESASKDATTVEFLDCTSPLYEGLWPMTIKAFRRDDGGDKEIFTFNLASR